jgi:ferrous iron transport protein B
MHRRPEAPHHCLIGNPNAGKTTLFNALTGANQRVGNYSGVTVELKSGETYTPHGKKLRVLDLPGCYSLRAPSPDEKVAGGCARGACPASRNRISSSAWWMPRTSSATFSSRCRSSSWHAHRLALNMVDMAEKSGLRLDPGQTFRGTRRAGGPHAGSAGKGIIELKQALRHPFPAAPHAKWSRRRG